MRLTLLRAKEALAAKAPPDQLEFRLNRACERLLLHGKFAGSIQRLAIAAPFGQITLPRAYRTMEGVKVDGVVVDLANQWYEFLPGRSDALGYSLNAVRDLGDGWAIMRTPSRSVLPLSTEVVDDFPVGGTITSTGACVLYGRDGNYMPVVMTFTGPGTQASTFAKVSRIHKEQGAEVMLTYTDTDANETILAIMEDSEEETYYRRYILDSVSNQADVAVSALCKRRHLEFTSDSDTLPFSNISALSLALDALQFESEGDKGRAEQSMLDAVGLLNLELGDTNADNSVPALRLLYPGRTQPDFNSFP